MSSFPGFLRCTAHAESFDGAWILDSGCTQHLTGNKGKSKTLKALERGKGIKSGNKQSLAAEGMGEVELNCRIPDGEQLEL
jgi:hypothetical protein